MKKLTKVSMATALVASALTPVAAFAAEGNAPAGFYNVNTGEVVTPDAFPFLSPAKKLEILMNAKNEVYYLDGSGKALAAGVLLTATTNEQVTAAQENETTVEERHNVEFTTGGKVENPTTGELNVESVKALNGGTLEIKFNSAVSSDIIDSNNQLNASGAIYVNNDTSVNLDGIDAELSEDGKTLTLYTSPSAVSGSFTINVAKDIIPGETEGTWVSGFEGVITINDTVRPTIVNVTPVSKYVFDINLSEPVRASAITPTAKYTDGAGVVNVTTQSLIKNNKTIRVTLDSTTLENKEVSLLFPALTDISGNVQVPTTAKVKVTNVDTTKPTLTSAKALSNRIVELKFSEELDQGAIAIGNIKVNNIALSGTDTAVVKNTDPTTVVVTLVTSPAIALDTAPVSMVANTVKDLAGNNNDAFSQLVNFSADKTGPVLESSKVVAGSPNKLKLVFNESINGTPTSSVDAYYIDTFGVKRTLTIPSGNFSVDTSDNTNKTVLVALNDGASALTANVDYTFEFAEGAFTDSFSNKSKAFDVNFNNNGSANTTKLKLNGNIDGTTKPGVVTVKFDQAVDPATATKVANYSVEGATIEKATLVANSTAGATVDLKLVDASIEVTGNYDVTVKNVKGFYSSIVAMSTTTENIIINENIRPEVVKVVVDEFNGSTTNLTFTFSENVSSTSLGADKHFELFIDGTKVSGATVTVPAITTTNTGTVAITKNLSADIAAGKIVTLKPVSTNDIKDAAGNKLKANVITVK